MTFWDCKWRKVWMCCTCSCWSCGVSYDEPMALCESCLVGRAALTSRGPSIDASCDEMARTRCSNSFARSANFLRTISLILQTNDRVSSCENGARRKAQRTHCRICVGRWHRAVDPRTQLCLSEKKEEARWRSCKEEIGCIENEMAQVFGVEIDAGRV